MRPGGTPNFFAASTGSPCGSKIRTPSYAASCSKSLSPVSTSTPSPRCRAASVAITSSAS